MRLGGVVNPNGSIPGAIAGKIVQDIPLAIVNISNFVRSSGYPPYISSPSFSSQLRAETFSLEGKSHDIKFIAGDKEEEIVIAVDPKPFGGNWAVKVVGEGAAVEKKDDTTALVHVKPGSGNFDVSIAPA